VVVRRDAIWRELRGVLIALLVVAATTVAGIGLREYAGVLDGSDIYLIAVLIVGWRYGLIPALAAAVAGSLWAGYLYYVPYYSFYVTSSREIINLALFLAVAAVVGQLANLMKRQTEIARAREREMSDLYAFSKRLAGAATPSDIYVAIEEHLATLVQRKVVLFGAGTDGKGAGAHDNEPVPQPVRDEIVRVQHDPTLETTVDDGGGNIWLVRSVSPKTLDFGVIAVDLGDISWEAVTEVRQRIASVLSDATATLEHLDVARALAEVRMRSETELLRDALIGSVSHELRTPLASILGAATVLCEAPALSRDPRLSALAGVVRDEAERLDSEIQNLLDATRISHHEVQPRLQWVEPVDIVNSALERRRRRLAGHPIRIQMDSDLPIVHVDPGQVEQALIQILDNAAKYSTNGSAINITARRNGHDVIMAVGDKGAGVTKEERPHMGERFFRGQRLATTTSGTGLGLWIANSFVKANGGRVEVVSKGADQGTTVLIHLPLSPHTVRPEIEHDE
jgi:two-component system, OmpR family, sensor histidine kinase KdpD